jgi:hypothetical protein
MDLTPLYTQAIADTAVTPEPPKKQSTTDWPGIARRWNKAVDSLGRYLEQAERANMRKSDYALASGQQ